MTRAPNDPGSGPTGPRLVYQPGYSRVLLGAVVCFGVWWVADEAIGPHPVQAVVTGLWLTAVTAALACLFWRPAVVVDDAGVELRNLVRDVTVPWPALERVDTRYTLTLHSGGRRYQSWAGVAPGRPSITAGLLSGGLAARPGTSGRGRPPSSGSRWADGATGQGRPSSRDLRADSGAAAFMIEQRWAVWSQTAGRRAEPPADLGGGSRAAAEQPRPAVRWRPMLPAVAGAAAVLALLLAPLAS